MVTLADMDQGRFYVRPKRAGFVEVAFARDGVTVLSNQSSDSARDLAAQLLNAADKAEGLEPDA